MLWMLGAALAAPPTTSTIWDSSGRPPIAGCLMATGRWAVLDSRGLHRETGAIELGSIVNADQVAVLGDCEMIAYAVSSSSTLEVVDPWKGDVQTLDAGIPVERIASGPNEKWIVVSDGKRIAAVDWKSGRAVQMDGKFKDGDWRFSKDGEYLQVATSSSGTSWTTRELATGAKVEVQTPFRLAEPRRWLSEWPTSWALGDGTQAAIGGKGVHVQDHDAETSGLLPGAMSLYRTKEESLRVAVYSGRPATGEAPSAFRIEELKNARKALLDWFERDKGARSRTVSAGGGDLDEEARKAFNELQRFQSRTFKTSDAAMKTIPDVAPGAQGMHLVLEQGEKHTIDLSTFGSFGLMLAALPEEIESFEVRKDGKILALTKLKPASTGVFTRTKFIMAVEGHSEVVITPNLKEGVQVAHVYAVPYRMRPTLAE